MEGRARLCAAHRCGPFQRYELAVPLREELPRVALHADAAALPLAPVRAQRAPFRAHAELWRRRARAEAVRCDLVAYAQTDNEPLARGRPRWLSSDDGAGDIRHSLAGASPVVEAHAHLYPSRQDRSHPCP